MESRISNNTLLKLLEWIMIDECSLLFQICFCNVARFMVNSYSRYKHSILRKGRAALK